MDTVDHHSHAFSTADWPFRDPEHTAAISTRQVLYEGLPILFVSHDRDGDWQILCGTSNDVRDGILLCLGCAFDRDRSIGELFDLPVGWVAWRDAVGHPWHRELGDSE